MTEYCAVIGTHSTVRGDKLLYGQIPDPFPQCGIGSGHARLGKPILSYFSVTTAPYLELSAIRPETPPTRKYHVRRNYGNKIIRLTVFLIYGNIRVVGRQLNNYAIN